MNNDKYVIAVLGGTGAEGSGLALRLANAGHKVILGSRNPEKAEKVSAELNQILGREAVSWQSNTDAAKSATIVILTVPYSAELATVEEVREHLSGKILVDATVPLAPPKVSRVQLPVGGSAVALIQEKLGVHVKVVSAFQNVSAHYLKDLTHKVECDVLVCGDDATARSIVVDLARDIGLRGVHGGVLANSAAAEALTSVLIAINMRYKVPGAGIRITGIEPGH